MIGKTLGHYEIEARVGSGGMGEVYRARDTRLGRSVAVKILPEQFTADRERVARFEREARLLASLNHPHIATLYDFAQHEGVYFLAMELVEGEDLSTRLARGPMAVDEAARVAAQVAEALEVAHENGVVHRDLKPANIRFSADGKVKVLDFGLAKAIESSEDDLDHSPTIVDVSTAGVILGTAAYMSPEQARGKMVDKRADIWAFGCVLFEMLTTHQLFQAETVSDTIAKILERQPAWDLLPANTPPRVKRLLERCLEKDVKRRLRDIGDARIELEDVIADSRVMAAPQIAGPRRQYRLLWLGLGLVVGALLSFVVLQFSGRREPEAPGQTRVSIKPNVDTVPLSMAPALSRDGRMLAYGARTPDGPRLFLRNLDSWESRKLTDTGAASPCFSPDGRWIAFRSQGDNGRLLRVSVEGGTPLLISKNVGGPAGIAWTQDGQIICPTSLGSGLVSIAAMGGTPTALTHPDSSTGELGHWQPWVLPDDDHVLFTSWRTRMDDARIEVVSRKSKETHVVVENGVSPMYMEPGYLLYVQGATLMCAPFDPDRAEVTGDPVPLIDPVRVSITDGASNVAVGGSNLCYLPDFASHARLVWADLNGKVEPIVPEERDYDRVSIAPDGRHMALCIEEAGKSDVWVLDSVRRSLTQLTVDGTNQRAIYSPDGRSITFQSMRRGPFELYSIAAQGGATPQLLFPSAKDLSPDDWTPDGKTLLFVRFNEGTGMDIMKFSREDEKVSPLVQSPFNESGAKVSPNGRWLAYDAVSSDRSEVYVSSMDGGGRTQISVEGGIGPRWAGDGQAIFYSGPQGEALYRVEVSLGPRFRASRPEKILSHEKLGGYVEDYDVYPDGKRLAIVYNRDPQGHRAFRLMMNVPQELARLTHRSSSH